MVCRGSSRTGSSTRHGCDGCVVGGWEEGKHLLHPSHAAVLMLAWNHEEVRIVHIEVHIHLLPVSQNTERQTHAQLQSESSRRGPGGAPFQSLDDADRVARAEGHLDLRAHSRRVPADRDRRCLGRLCRLRRARSRARRSGLRCGARLGFGLLLLGGGGLLLSGGRRRALCRRRCRGLSTSSWSDGNVGTGWKTR